MGLPTFPSSANAGDPAVASKAIPIRAERNPLVRDVRVIIYDGKMHPVDSNDISFKIAGLMAFKTAYHIATAVKIKQFGAWIFGRVASAGNCLDLEIFDLQACRSRLCKMCAVFIIEGALLGHREVHSVWGIKRLSFFEKCADAGIAELWIFVQGKILGA